MSSFDQALARTFSHADAKTSRAQAHTREPAGSTEPLPAAPPETVPARGWVSTLRPPSNRAAHWQWPAVTSELLTMPGSPIGGIAHDILELMNSRQHQSLGVTGTASGAGCSTLVLTLARCLAEHQPVIIVDANFEQPQLAGQLGLLNPTTGLWEVLTGQAPLESAILTLEPQRVRILPLLAPIGPNQAAEIWPGLQRLLAILPCLDEYSLILIDAGVVQPGREWSSSAVQSMLQVTRSSVPDSAALASACQSAGVNLLGTVETSL